MLEFDDFRKKEGSFGFHKAMTRANTMHARLLWGFLFFSFLFFSFSFCSAHSASTAKTSRKASGSGAWRLLTLAGASSDWKWL
jgi:hypothetical protein